MRHIKILAIFLLASFSIMAAAQDKEVHGIVTDVTGEPLAGVGVIVEGTTIGTVTGLDGLFTLAVPDKEGVVLLFSSIGFSPKSVPVNGTSKFEVVLNESSEFIEETVVIGYGSVKKSDLTGSVASMAVDDLDAIQATSFDKLLQGKMAGVNVTTGSAAPGGTMNITIRGSSTINGSSEPLYVVDGIIINSSGDTGTVFSGSNVQKSQDGQNALSMLNPNDIASIEVLKDASATAIYGAEGANGVVIITTKKGTSDRPTVNFSHSTDLAWNPKHFDVLNLDEYIQYRYDLTGETLDKNKFQEIDWQDYAQRLAVSNNTRVSVSGKTASDNYYISLGYLDNQGVLKTTGVRQIDGRINYSVNIGKYLKLGTNTSLSYRVNNMTQGTDMNSGGGGMFTSMIRQMVNTRPYKVTDLTDVSDTDALIGVDRWLNDYEDISNEFRLLSSIYAEISILPNLKWRSSVGVDYRNKDRVRYEGPQVVNVNQSYTSRLGIAQMQSFKYNTDHQLTYTPKLGKHHSLTAMVGMSMSSTGTVNRQFQGTDMTITDYRENGFNYANTTTVPSYNNTISSLMSFFTRLIYNYRDRYIVTATYRADGSSKFAPGNKFGFFPSFAAAWNINRESFMENVGFISNLKLRAGWGQVGNQTLSPYQTLLNYGTTTVPIYDPDLGGSFTTGAVQNNIVNESLKWETSESVNVGLDMGFLDNRINLTVDLYNKITKDLLLKVNVPPSMAIKNGVNSVWENRGTVQNKGLELSMEVYPVRTSNLIWSISGNISLNRNKILKLNIQDAKLGVYNGKCFLGNNISGATYLTVPANIFMEGYPMGMFSDTNVTGSSGLKKRTSIRSTTTRCQSEGSSMLTLTIPTTTSMTTTGL